MKAEPSCGVCTEAQGRRGEAGVKGLVSRWARRATSPEKSGLRAGEARRWWLRNVGGGGKRTHSGKGREARVHRTHARARLPPARRPGLLTDCTPNADGADVRGGATRPHPAGACVPPRVPRGGGSSLVSFMGIWEAENGNTFYPPCAFRPPPPRRMGWEVLGVSGRVRSGFSRPL